NHNGVAHRAAHGPEDLPISRRAARGSAHRLRRGESRLGRARRSAVHGDIDAHLVALDMKSGGVLFDVPLADYKVGYSATVAPLVIKDKVIVGIAGAEFGIRGFIDAYDAENGARAWRLYTVAGPDEPRGNPWPEGGAY